MLGIIPARGGSKGLPGKNIRLLGGKPLIHWTIEEALKAKRITKLILSTDDQNIADVCRSTGIDIPFMRPSELAQDESLAIDNYVFTVNKLQEMTGCKIENFAVFLPTSPLRNSKDIDNAIDLFSRKKADSVISCTDIAHPLEWALSVSKDLKISKCFEKFNIKNRQNLSTKYVPNGGIYVFNFEFLQRKYSYYSKNSYAYVMSREKSIDIDTEFDFLLAEFIHQRRLSLENGSD